MSARAMLRRVSRVEQSKVSPLLGKIGSLEKWTQGINDGIAEGRLDPEATFLVHVMRRWLQMPFVPTVNSGVFDDTFSS